ncbi:calcium:proton antiporter [Microbacterium protaetiae]|uniref:Calcium:proton antiporter n=1 Tax=Microbacterium protaetiae TaxID=2509458 RepID=A0A4V0YDT6_9MICO|nr:calcium:proton antiporter [Microbacterium protaetiae]QAY61841.1 calcium:proton antiporter [Microbacterium protaetiae]
MRAVFTPGALARVVVGWLAFGALTLLTPALTPPAPAPLLIAVLAGTVAVVVVCAFGVVHQAERLAARLGDPLGTLVLTLSIVLIEVVLIAAVMLGPGDHATIARDSVLAVSMIILNLVVGLSLLVGGLRHGRLRHNRTGTSTYLGMLVVLLALAFGMPQLIGQRGSFTGIQAVVVIVLTVGSYAFFLWRQTGAQAGDFVEVTSGVRGATQRSGAGAAAQHPVADHAPCHPTAGTRTTPRHPAPSTRAASEHPAVGAAPQPPAVGPAPQHPVAGAALRHPSTQALVRTHRSELIARLGLLILTVLPIVLLSHDLAAMLDDGLARLRAPTALSGILIAAIVFLPEAITSVRAARAGEIQRVSNLCHGALVSTVGLTVPAVLAVGLVTAQPPVLALDPVGMLLVAASLLLSIVTFSGRRVTAAHGVAHLVLFAAYGLSVFA